MAQKKFSKTNIHGACGIHWQSNLKGELAKLKVLMQTQFSELQQDPLQWDPNFELVDAEKFGGNKNQFIACRNVDGVLTPAFPEDTKENFDESLNNITSLMTEQFKEEPMEQDITFKTPANPDAMVALIKAGVKNLTSSSAHLMPLPYQTKGLDTLHRVTIFTVITKKGKRIDIDHDALLFFQKKADGFGKVSTVYENEEVEIDIGEVTKAIHDGKKVMLLKDDTPTTPLKPIAESASAMSLANERLLKSMGKNKVLLKKPRK